MKSPIADPPKLLRTGATLGEVGRGLGQIYDREPNVLHYGQPGQGLQLEAGMVFTIEPMLNAGKRETHQLADGWAVVTKDRSLSAQWEHMVR